MDPNLEAIKSTTEAVLKTNQAFEEFKKTNDLRLKEIEKFGEATAATQEKLVKIEGDLSVLQDIQKKLEKVENRVNRPGFGGEKSEDITPEQKEYADALFNMIRNPQDAKAHQDVIQKSVLIGTPAQGGYAVPEVISRQINQKLLDISPVRSVAKVVTVSTSDYKELVDVLGTGYEWVGESDTRNQTGAPRLEEVAPTFGIIAAKPQASEEALQDIFFDVQNWLVNSVAEHFAKGEGIAFISGNGTKKPTGFLNGSGSFVNKDDEDTSSPVRPFGVLQYIPSGKAGGFPNDRVGSPAGNPVDCLYDLVYSLKAAYRRNAVFMMNKATLATISKFKDGDGNYIWRPSLAAGQPSTLLGFPVIEAEDMPDIGSNTFPVAFGDFGAGYLIADRVGTRITVDDNITTPGFIKFYVRKRVGGKLLNDDAIKVLKMAAS